MKEITLKQMIGKKVIGYVLSNISRQAVITFEDNTFTTLGIESGWEWGDETICQSSLDITEFGDDAIISAGIISEIELASLRELTSTKQKEYKEASDRAEYKRLKEKFKIV